MKAIGKILFSLLIIFSANVVSLAQDKPEARALVKQGIDLNKAGKYAEAIEKYKQALKIDPNNVNADFEMAFALYNSGKGMDAMPYLQTVLASGGSKYAAYDLLGSVYDDSNQTEKAVEAYKNGIRENPGYERLHYNLGVTYLRQKKFAEAEASAIDALRLDPLHPSAHRLYAIAVYNQNKEVAAIMGFCNFLLLEPQSKRSPEAFKYLQNIFLNAAGMGAMNNQADKGTSPANIAEASITAGAMAAAKLTNTTPPDKMAAELQTVFITTAKQARIVRNKTFFWNFYAMYFGKMADSNLIPALAHFISLSVYHDENVKWFKDNNQYDSLNAWTRSTTRHP